MTNLETRLGRLEAYRDMDAAQIKELRDDVKAIDGKLDVLIAARNTASWLTRGLMPAFWALLASGAGAIAAMVKWH